MTKLSIGRASDAFGSKLRKPIAAPSSECRSALDDLFPDPFPTFVLILRVAELTSQWYEEIVFGR